LLAVAVQVNDAAAMVGMKRGREEQEDDASKRARQEADAAAAAAAAAAAQPAADHMDPTGGTVAADAAAAAAAAAAAGGTSDGFAAQLGAGGQLFAMTGPDGQPVLQVVPLQLPGQIDASGLGQIDLSQLDPSTLQVGQCYSSLSMGKGTGCS
jgi:hypothetical protein